MPTLIARLLHSTRIRPLPTPTSPPTSNPDVLAVPISISNTENAPPPKKRERRGTFILAGTKLFISGGGSGGSTSGVKVRRRSQSMASLFRPGKLALEPDAYMLPPVPKKHSASHEDKLPPTYPTPALGKKPSTSSTVAPSDTPCTESASPAVHADDPSTAVVPWLLYTEGLPDYPPTEPVEVSPTTEDSEPIGILSAGRRSYCDLRTTSSTTTLTSLPPLPARPVLPTQMRLDSSESDFLSPHEKKALGRREDDGVTQGVPPPLPEPMGMPVGMRGSVIFYGFQKRPEGE